MYMTMHGSKNIKYTLICLGDSSCALYTVSWKPDIVLRCNNSPTPSWCGYFSMEANYVFFLCTQCKGREH